MIVIKVLGCIFLAIIIYGQGIQRGRLAPPGGLSERESAIFVARFVLATAIICLMAVI